MGMLERPSPLRANRRGILRGAAATAFAALLVSGKGGRALAQTAPFYGPLRQDPAALLDLPEGFSYRIISRMGDAMDDGGTVPDRADGMGCFALPGGKLALVRNHELKIMHDAGGTLLTGYDRDRAGHVLPGGTTTLVLNAATLSVERQFRSLAGTIRNCAGGTTPWGSWLTCEEDVTRAGGKVGQDHGWVFEVPATATTQVEAVPLKAMGRFYHEAAAVDPETRFVYMTEDRDDGLLYRFLPDTPGKLADGGKLQALALPHGTMADSRNWSGPDMVPGSWHAVRWIDLDDVESPADDLRHRGAAAGALLFARGEGIHMGEGELFFCCTSGGARQYGQVFRLSLTDGGDRLQLFFESRGPEEYNFGDNLTVAPNGHLIVCEDQYTEVVDNYLRGITPQGVAYPLARLRRQTELAGACFSPDGQTLFVNAYSPAMTLAITGPWQT
ncbi:phosphatase [Croceicoccus estronivorus]|nr:phosphatase [Croceicoccus estronivorus]